MENKNIIKCLLCGDVLESKSLHDLVMCSCDNKAFTDGGSFYQRVGAEDISKIEIFDPINNTFRKIEV